MDVKVRDIETLMEEMAPLRYQETYDNAGLQIGDRNMAVSAVLVTIDVTEGVIDEAIEKGCNMIVSHHPLIFRGIKRLTGSTYVERCVEKAIRNGIAIYASHTNMDKAEGGVSWRMAEKMGLRNLRVLSGEPGILRQVVTFVPEKDVKRVMDAMAEAGAGSIGKYDRCSYRTTGIGTFRASEGCRPYVGEIGETHEERECRIEMVAKEDDVERIREAIRNAHPYEEPVTDVYRIEQRSEEIGIGVIGETETEMTEMEALKKVKETFGCGDVRYSHGTGRKVRTIAMCGGSGADLIKAAIASGADMYVTADCKYHEFFDADGRILVADIGHFESEQYTKEIFAEQIRKKFSKFAVYNSQENTNPINHL